MICTEQKKNELQLISSKFYNLPYIYFHLKGVNEIDIWLKMISR